METTHSIWGLLDEELTLGDNKSILFEMSDEHEDGTYPLVMHYVTLANKIDKEGASAWLNRMAGRKNKLNFKFFGGVTIIREVEYEEKAKLVFDKPISIIMGYVGEDPIVTKVTQISGEFSHDWFWTSNKRQSKIANGFEISFNIEKLLV